MRFVAVPLAVVINPRLTLALARNRNRRRLLLSFLILLIFLPSLRAQESTAGSALTFDFANIRPSAPHTQGHRFRVTGHRFEATNTSLVDLISFAFGLHATQIIGAPDWVRSDRFDLTLQATAKSEMDEARWTEMLQGYLVQCFKLRFHRDVRDMPLYVLSIAQSGPRLASSKSDRSKLPELSIALGSKDFANANVALLTARNATMADLAGVLQRIVLARPVVDHTGIAGRYDFALTWTPEGAEFGDARTRIPPPIDIPEPPPHLVPALQQQMGLIMDLLEAPLDVLVIEDAEEPRWI